MKNSIKSLIQYGFCIPAFILIQGLSSVSAQTLDSAQIATMTREEIRLLTKDQLLDLSMENLVFLAEKMGISIDELLNLKTSVASKVILTPRETPGIVSFITKEEITNSGARDLIDVLRMVPGFDFGYDVQGVVGVGLRGNWVHEGKILMMIDGLPVNELSYANIPFGNHFPVDQIKRIEIIRGPGSTMYGGTAELGVINIITDEGSDLNGTRVTGTYGISGNNTARDNINVSTGFNIGSWDIAAHEFIGKANRSDQPFIEYISNHDNIIDLSEGGSEINTRQINFSATNDTFSFRFIYDDYKTQYNYFEDSATGNKASVNEFRSALGEIKYNYHINNKLNIIPSLKYKYNRPYFEKDYWRNFRINRLAGSLMSNYLPDDKTTLVAGIEYYSDYGHCIEDSGYFFSDSSRNLRLNNLILYAEGIRKMGKVNMVAGIRAEHNSKYGWAAAPRIGLTGVFGKFHFKALFSSAFRSPAIGNIDVANSIRPEKSYITEVEMGYRLNNSMFITANIFDIAINKSIMYFDNGGWDPGTDWGYKNTDNSGSDGMEIEWKVIHSKGYLTLNYSYYTQAFRKIPELYAVPGHNNDALALARQKLALNTGINLGPHMTLNPSAVLIGKKYAYTDVDSEENPLVSPVGPDYLINFSLVYHDLLVKGLDISCAVFDILNEKPPFIQPYDGGFYPFPGSSRELVFRIMLNSQMLGDR
ncbi:MAG TPA: TonB-dependent receptor [Bacteroidales bacterium]|nr:TonB-dependent receptor [Bacteroidales bacterium]